MTNLGSVSIKGMGILSSAEDSDSDERVEMEMEVNWSGFILDRRSFRKIICRGLHRRGGVRRGVAEEYPGFKFQQ